MSKAYVYILLYDDWVNLGFNRGVDLPDPDGLVEGTGALMRQVKVGSVELFERFRSRRL